MIIFNDVLIKLSFSIKLIVIIFFSLRLAKNVLNKVFDGFSGKLL